MLHLPRNPGSCGLATASASRGPGRYPPIRAVEKEAGEDEKHLEQPASAIERKPLKVEFDHAFHLRFCFCATRLVG